MVSLYKILSGVELAPASGSGWHNLSPKFVEVHHACKLTRAPERRLNKISIYKASDPAILKVILCSPLSSDTIFGGPSAHILVGEREKGKKQF